MARKRGYKGDDLGKAIKHLERFGAPSDSNTPDFGGGLQHHLRDFAHHPTLVGLIFSMVTQFTEKSYGTNTDGSFMIVDVKNKNFIGKNIYQKFCFGTIYWFFHLVSDMAGSNATPGAGTGLPGPLLSFAKELSTLPFFRNIKINDNSLSIWISKLFNGTLLAERDSEGKIIKQIRFDLRAEIGISHELGQQAIPVIINECVVRGFYFIRNITKEIKEKNIKKIEDLNKVEWNNCLPWNNRTIIRMLTIATGTFTACDLIDAAIRGGIKSGGNQVLFAKEFLLHINFVGVGRFAVAVFSDTKIGVKQSRLRNQRIAIYNEQLHLANAKIFYLQTDMWIAAEKTEQTINEVFDLMDKTAISYTQSMRNIEDDLDKIEQDERRIEEDKESIRKFINEISKGT